MIEHRASLFYTLTRRLADLQLGIREAIKLRGGNALPDKSEADLVRVIVKRLRATCDEFEFSRVLERLYNFNPDEPLLQPLRGEPLTLAALKFELAELNNEIARTLGQTKFMMIPAYDAAYHENPDLFGPEFARRFPHANEEITEAGNCYAAGNYTACVFHLMRGVELGARVMVRGLRVGKRLNRKVELCDWGELIGALESGLKSAAVGRRRSVATSEKSEFYNHAVGQFRNFKDAWRNNVSHMRKSYQQGEAKDILENTRQFMQHLATRLGE